MLPPQAPKDLKAGTGTGILFRHINIHTFARATAVAVVGQQHSLGNGSQPAIIDVIF